MERVDNIFKEKSESFSIACSSLLEVEESKKMFCLYWLYPELFSIETAFNMLDNSQFSNEELELVFFMDEEKLLKDISDLRWKVIDKVFKSKKEDFKSRHPLDSIYANAAALSAYGSRTPEVFQYLLTLLEADIGTVSISAKGAIVTNAFALSTREILSSKEYYTSQSVNDLFEISFEAFFKNPSVDYVKTIANAIYYWELDNIKLWCNNKRLNQGWFLKFDNLDDSFKGLKKETIRFVNSK